MLKPVLKIVGTALHNHSNFGANSGRGDKSPRPAVAGHAGNLSLSQQHLWATESADNYARVEIIGLFFSIGLSSTVTALSKYSLTRLNCSSL